ncbi:MAG: hypothetical protein HW412_1996 [Bacteroidetes bacterium]|nr:hypothetical protein [Bacteroidota bacterium]
MMIVSQKLCWFLIFVSLWLFFPAIYFILVAAGWLPGILYLAFCFGPDALFWIVHVLVYAIIYYLAAMGLARLLFRIADPRRRAYVLYGAIALMALASLFPIYAVGLHARGYAVNIVGAFREAGKISTVPW